MTTSQPSTGQSSLVRIDIDGEKYRLNLSHLSRAAQLRTILVERYEISSDTHFLDPEGYALFPGDEQSVSISELLTENNVVRLTIVNNESTAIKIPEEKNNISEKDVELKDDQTLDQSIRTTSPELKLPDSTPTHSEKKIVVAADLDIDMWERIFRNCNLLYGIRMDKETPIRAVTSVLKFKESIVNFEYHVTDGSNIRKYMKHKEMHSSFLSSLFFDGEIDVSSSSSLIGIGINAEYSKSKTTTNIHKKTYLTFCINFPRITFELDLSYLEPTTEFIEAIDTVLMTLTPDEQIIKLEEVLSIYGHVYPRSIVSGGHLCHTEVHDNQEKAKKAKRRLNTDVSSFSASLIQSGKFHAEDRSAKESENKSSERTSRLTFEAVGGDTLLNRDPTLWINTVADPFLWRIIEQDNYQSIITLLDQERQQKLQKIFNYYTMKKRLLNRKWKQDGITIAGGNGYGQQLNQLAYPQSIFIDDDQTIYIADWKNHRIVEWKCHATKGQIVAGANGEGTEVNQLHLPTDVIIDKEHNSLIISDYGNRRIVRLSRQKTAINGQIIISDIECWGLTMDKSGSLYVSDEKKNEVRRWNRGDQNGTIVAGGNGKGNHLNQLNHPTHIFVDEDYSLYISDTNNHRVMKWLKDAKEGTVVAGGNGYGNSLSQLHDARGIAVDQLGQIYVADFRNDRVMRWCKGAKEGTIVVGRASEGSIVAVVRNREGTIVVSRNREGKQSNQFIGPVGLSFDGEENLYVIDGVNNRIQKFEIN